jgi:S1-C subfamily serine protease
VSFGISGADWEEGGVRGVEILQVAPDSAASLAGLHWHDVITDINGKHVRSTQDLSTILSSMEPGTRASVGYLTKTYLGWMPKEAIVILAKGE